MKRKFRILEIADDDGDVHFIVQQQNLWFFWWKSEFEALTHEDYFWDGTVYKYIKFENMIAVKRALEQVKEAMKKKSKAYTKVVEVVTIEV